MRRRNRQRGRRIVPAYTGAPRRYRYTGPGRIHLPLRLRGGYPSGLVAGSEFVDAVIDWATKPLFERVEAVKPLPVVTPEPVTLTPEQFAGLSFKDGKAYAFGLYGIKARSKKELLREYTEARG